MVGLVLRYAPLYVDLRKAQQDGLLGDVASIEASEHIPPYHGAFFMRDWRRYEQLFRRLPAGEMLPRSRSLQRRDGLPSVARGELWRPPRHSRPSNAPQGHGANDLEVYHRKPSGWLGSDKVFDSDGDIIDFQTAIVEYANGASLTFHTNLNVPDDFRRFAVIGAKGMAEGDFVRNYFRSPMPAPRDKLIDKTYVHSEAVRPLRRRRADGGRCAGPSARR